MAQTPFTGLLTGSSTPFLATGDIVAFVDVSDTTQSPSGSLVKGTLTQFFSQLPVPVAIKSASATAFTVGLNGATNPALTVDASTALQVAGVKVTGAVTGGTVAVVVTDSGADASLTVNAKGTGTIGIGSVSTGRVTITPVTTITGLLTLTAGVTGPLTVATTSASGLAVGRQGATDPVLLVDASTASVATGLKIKGAAAAGGLALSVITSGTNENLTMDAAGSGTITVGGTSTGAISIQGASSRFGASGLSYTTTVGGGGTSAAARTVLCNIDVNSNGTGANVGNGAFQIIRGGNGSTGWQMGLFVNTNAVLTSNLDLGFYSNDGSTYAAALSQAGKLTLLGGLAATTGDFSGAVVCSTTLTVSAGLASFTKTTAAQAVFAGWDEVGGAGGNKGQILIGGTAASQGRIHYDDAGQTVLYIDNSYDAGASTGIKMRVRTAGTPVVGLSIDGAGSVAINNVVNAVSPTSPNRTVTMVVGGVTLYLHAKTTND